MTDILHRPKPMALRIGLALLALCALSVQNAHSSPLSILTGESEKTKKENERKASQMLEDLLNDGALTQGESDSAFVTLIGVISDNVLESIYESLSPSVSDLISTNGSPSSRSGMLDESSSLLPVSPESVIGRLMALLLCIECILLGIKSFFSDGTKTFSKALSKLVMLSICVIFLSFIPLIGRSVINLFASLANAVSSRYAQSSATPSSKLFAYMPSDALDALSFCKGVLSIEKIRIGGYSLVTIIPHLTISIGELLISIPFLYIMIMIVFWYSEMFIILLSAYVVIPICMLSELNIASVKGILKALIIQGSKLFAGIFISNMTTHIILSAVRKLNGTITSTANTVIFCVFMAMVVFFLLQKGPDAMTRAFEGETSKGGGVLSGAVGGSVAALASALPFQSKKKTSPLRLPLPQSPSGDADAKWIRTAPSTKTSVDTKKDIASDKSGPIGKKPNKGLGSYGEVSAKASVGRMEAARTELMNEGVQNISDSMVKNRAIRDAKIEKLVKMEKNGFITNDGEFNKPAYEQLQRLRKREE